MRTNDDTSSATHTEEPKHGQGLRASIDQRRLELEVRLAELQNSEQQGGLVAEAIESALLTLDSLLPADLEHISPAVAVPLTHWLESHRHLGVVEAKPRRTRRRAS